VSLEAKVFQLVSKLRDPTMRIDVASSIKFLADVYRLGRANEEDIFNDLMDICMTVYKETEPDLSDEEVRDKAEDTAKDLMRIIKITGVTRRVSQKYGLQF